MCYKKGAYMHVCLMQLFYLILGIYEALELRDGGSDYLGKGVSKVGFELNDSLCCPQAR